MAIAMSVHSNFGKDRSKLDTPSSLLSIVLLNKRTLLRLGALGPELRCPPIWGETRGRRQVGSTVLSTVVSAVHSVVSPEYSLPGIPGPEITPQQRGVWRMALLANTLEVYLCC